MLTLLELDSPDQKTRCACTSTSNPGHPLPSCPPSHWHVDLISIRLGCAPTQGSPIFTDWWGLGASGATPRMGSCCWARVAVRFFSHDARRSASPYSDLGMPLLWVNARICSRSMRFNRSAMLFHCRVLWVVSFLAVLAAARCLSNTALRYLQYVPKWWGLFIINSLCYVWKDCVNIQKLAML